MTELLIVDDDIENRQMIRSIVENSHFNYLTVYEAVTADSGYALLKQGEPTVMIMDLSLPDEDGISFGKSAMELYPSMQIIVTTYLKMFETVQGCINLGFAAYLLKPLSKSETLEVLERILTRGLLRESRGFLDKETTSKFGADLANPVQTTIRFIQSNFNKQITLKEVADLVYLSPSHFSRLFKEDVGTTFVEYLTNIRIEKSKSLLKMTSLPIEVIAHHVGFTSASYFATSFKRAEDKTPREYRYLFDSMNKDRVSRL